MVARIPCPSESALLSAGSVSGNTPTSSRMSSRARDRAKKAGYWNVAKESSRAMLLPHKEKRAPMRGPSRKPMENAIPMTACRDELSQKVCCSKKLVTEK